MFHRAILILLLTLLLVSAACQPAAAPAPQASGPAIKVLVTETFLADVAQNVAGDRLHVTPLLPAGMDPHSYEPTPRDVALVAASQVLIVNGAGLEAYLAKLLENAGGKRQVIEASAGLVSRTPREGEPAPDEHEGDPHFWLDPNHVIQYAQNIRDGLSQADPAGATTYAHNADNYTAQLKELDQWISQQVQQIPQNRRLLVTNHESFGYFADRYGFKIIGTIILSVSTGVSPSAQQLAQLVDHIKAAGAPAIFLESGSNPQLARQIAQETGGKVVTTLYTHSTESSVRTYIEMMKYNTQAIVDALK